MTSTRFHLTKRRGKKYGQARTDMSGMEIPFTQIRMGQTISGDGEIWPSTWHSIFRPWKERSISDLKRKYGVTSRKAEEIVAARQTAVCDICKERKSLVQDHDHKTDGLRGLLCTRCNLIVGMIENPLYPEAREYIGRWPHE